MKKLCLFFLFIAMNLHFLQGQTYLQTTSTNPGAVTLTHTGELDVYLLRLRNFFCIYNKTTSFPNRRLSSYVDGDAFLYNYDEMAKTFHTVNIGGQNNLSSGLTILSNGYTGIGVSSPTEKLQVAGTIHSTSGGFKFPDGSVLSSANNINPWTKNGTNVYYNDGNVGIGISNAESKLEVYNGDIVIGGPYKKFLIHTQYWNSSSHRLFLVPKNNNSWDFSNQFEFWDNGKFVATGSIGIGTTNTEGYGLVVNGNILCESVKVINDVPSSDYVFNADYNLKPIKEVEEYINENKHLPEVPSAQEFKENGYKVGEMDNILLKKIEELTLYVIELKKEIEELKVKQVK